MFVLARLHPWVLQAPTEPHRLEVAASVAPAAAPALPLQVVPAEIRFPPAAPPEGPAPGAERATRRAAPGRLPSRAAGPRVDRAMFVVRDASAVQVTCGDVSAEGTATVRITSFPAGSCSVVATGADGRTVARGDVVVDGPQRVLCATDGGALRCSPTR